MHNIYIDFVDFLFFFCLDAKETKNQALDCSATCNSSIPKSKELAEREALAFLFLLLPDKRKPCGSIAPIAVEILLRPQHSEGRKRLKRKAGSSS